MSWPNAGDLYRIKSNARAEMYPGSILLILTAPGDRGLMTTLWRGKKTLTGSHFLKRWARKI